MCTDYQTNMLAPGFCRCPLTQSCWPLKAQVHNRNAATLKVFASLAMQDLSGEASQTPGGRLRLANGISSSESDIGSKPPSAKALSCNGHASLSAADRLPSCKLQMLQQQDPYPASITAGHKLTSFMQLVKHRRQLIYSGADLGGRGNQRS